MLTFVKDRFLRKEIQKEEREIKIGFTISAFLILALLANVIYLNLFIIKISSQKPAEPIAVQATPTPAPIETPQPAAVSLQLSSSVQTNSKEYYLNFGSGTNQSTDWADVVGTLNTYDLSQFKNIKEVHLESNINVPTANGTISIRLFNKTDNYAVWNSERTVQAQAKGDLIVSPNIIYDLGPKLYQIQIKSQLGVLANLIQARLHIVAQ